MKKLKIKSFPLFLVLIIVQVLVFSPQFSNAVTDNSTVLSIDTVTTSYTIVDTGLTVCYDNMNEISYPVDNSTPFYGQDAQFIGNHPHYQDNGDGTVTDLNTGLMWQQNPGEKLTYDEAVTGAASFDLAGYDDWRLPSIKELYSLIQFSGTDPSIENSNTNDLIPFIDTDYFVFEYGDESAGERVIDSQYWSSTEYISTTMGGAATTFGVNFADGRIKGYPTITDPVMGSKTNFVMYVRGNNDYGINDFNDNGDGTISDSATGLMWAQNDSGVGMNWEEALAWVQQMNNESYLGYNDWRLPNAKELQSIVDYSRAPAITDSAAIDPIFNISTIIDEGSNENYPFFWSSTTHRNLMSGSSAAYICFGEALGFMQDPQTSEYELQDVHGAGAQRSDPKEGDPNDYPYGHGPQGDVVRINNYVRLVRGGVAELANSSDDYPTYSPPTNQFGLTLPLLGFFGVGLFLILFILRKRN